METKHVRNKTRGRITLSLYDIPLVGPLVGPLADPFASNIFTNIKETCNS